MKMHLNVHLFQFSYFKKSPKKRACKRINDTKMKVKALSVDGLLFQARYAVNTDTNLLPKTS